MEITAFTDCHSDNIVIRMPYELLMDILKYLPADKGRVELLEKVSRAAQRSSKLTNLLKDFKRGLKNDSRNQSNERQAY